ncbi:hypothetical protein BST97_10330 [Nonlabens spongiae]|uniref:Fibronectin type-III domain-containing protein n=1 Tax=Nonlabens spongiae TaxID=331648 RepID=A0A1W6ML68_9FLAO|nr:fibronectin type III domain-containing protein [Nonlabens spongiae]ARN78354.1 hypothetical protein BST97_10330 [Nonlabens spongiae]
MKRNLLFCLVLLFSIYQLHAQTCTETLSESGLDNDPVVVSFTSFPCAGGGEITGLSLTTTNTSANCNNWYSYNISVTHAGGTETTTDNCNVTSLDISSFNGATIDVTTVTAITITSIDDDNFFAGDSVTIDASLQVSFIPPACPIPTALTASNVLPTSADLGWTAGGTETVWDIEWGVSGFTQGGGIMINDTSDNPYALSGLSSGTSYDFYVRADCGGDESSWAGPFNFITTCVPTTSFPSLDDFETANNCNSSEVTSDTTDWNRQFGSGGDITGAYAGDYWMQKNFSSSTANFYSEQYDLSGETDDFRINVWLHRHGSADSDDKYEIYFNSSPSLTGATLVQTLFSLTTTAPTVPSTGWYNYTYNVPAALNGTSSVYFIVVGTTSAGFSSYDLGIDNLQMEPVPACLPPTSLTATNTTTTSAELGWTAGDSETIWDIEWGVSGFTQGGGTMINDTSDNPYTLSGLSSGTSYDFYIRANCGGSDSSWTGPFSFSTDIACGDTVTGLCYSQTSTIEVLASFEASSGDWAEIVFNSGNTEDTYDEILVYDGLNGTGNLIFGTTSNGVYDTAGLDPVVSTTGQISLAINSDGSVTCSSDPSIDPISITLNCVTPPSCLAPSALSVSNITATSADLGWTAGDSETLWDIEWGADGFTQGSGTMINNTSDNPYNLTGLSSNTDYEFYVRADCGGGDESTWVGPFDFMTSPNTVALPINESFESGLTMFDNAPGNSTDWVVNTSYFKVGSQSATNAHGSSNTNILQQTSIFDLSSTPDAVLQFWHIAKLEGTYDKGFVEISTDGGNTYSPLPASAYLGQSSDYDSRGYFHEDSYELWGTTDTTPDNTTWWKRETFDLSGYSSSTMRLRFRLTSDSSQNRAGWFVDDVTVREAFVYESGAWNNSPVGASDSSSTVIIKDGTATQSGAFVTSDLIIASGSNLDIAGGSVTVMSYMHNSGQISGGGNRLIMSGTSTSEISGEGQIGNLEINNSNGVILNGDQGIFGRLFLTSGVFTTNDRLTFRSRVQNTAALAEHNPLSSSISGNVTVERYIPASNRAYRFLTTSVSGQSVFDAWQESGDNSNGFGTQITGTIGSVGSVNPTTGHDETISGNPSMFEYEASTNSWLPISDTRAEILDAGTFYRLLIRGNRTFDLSSNTGTVTDVTLRSTGTLIEGPVTINGTGTGNYLGIGNPYQAQVDMSATTRNSIAADMYYYDPTLGTQGAYTYVEISSGANTNGTASNAANILHPGQAVFLLESGASASVEFNEDDKTTASTQNIGIFSNPTNAAYLNLRLLGVASGSSTPTNLDGLMMKFDATENLALDFDDARKWQNLDENLAIDKGNNELLAIERRPQPIADEVVNLSLTQYRNTDYQFEVTLDLLPGLKAYIKDNLNNTMTEIIQGGASTTTTYNFTVDPNNSQSVATDRFQLIFETVTLGLEPAISDSISFYPNPVNGNELNIALGSALSNQDVQLNVYNSVGQLIRSVSENTGSSARITLSGMNEMSNGVYFVTLKGENLEHTEKIVVK